MYEKPDFEAIARHLVERHGSNAGMIAETHAVHFYNAGNIDAAAIWAIISSKLRGVPRYG